MASTVTDWKYCRHGGTPGGNGHHVPPEKMTYMISNGIKIHLCEDCKAIKLQRRNAVHKLAACKE